MNKNILSILAILSIIFLAPSCNKETEDEYNPFDTETEGYFFPSSITIDKNTVNTTLCERWTNIKKDSADRIVQYNYDYSYRTNDGESKTEKRNCRIYYFKDHTGKDIIKATTILEYDQNLKGITKEYTQKLDEAITLNSNGHISRISTTIAHFENGAADPTMKTSERSFTYYNDFCTSSTYLDNTCKISYTYNWNAYQLTGMTIVKENYADGHIEYDRYEYTYDNDKLYLYSGAGLLPFVQRGLPEIFAATGYFGKCTPYILAQESHNGQIKHNNSSTIKTAMTNRYSFNGDADFKKGYSALSSIYSTFEIVFNR